MNNKWISLCLVLVGLWAMPAAAQDPPGFRLAWYKALDDVTPQAQLWYKVVSSPSPTTIDTPAEADANGTIVMDWRQNIDAILVNRHPAPIFYAVLVSDAANNVKGYPIVVVLPQVALPPNTLAAAVKSPLNGAALLGGTLPVSLVASDEVGVRRVELLANNVMVAAYPGGGMTRSAGNVFNGTYTYSLNTASYKGRFLALEVRAFDADDHVSHAFVVLSIQK